MGQVTGTWVGRPVPAIVVARGWSSSVRPVQLALAVLAVLTVLTSTTPLPPAHTEAPGCDSVSIISREASSPPHSAGAIEGPQRPCSPSSLLPTPTPCKARNAGVAG